MIHDFYTWGSRNTGTLGTHARHPGRSLAFFSQTYSRCFASLMVSEFPLFFTRSIFHY